MSSDTSYVKRQIVYWGQVAAAAAAGQISFTNQNGPGLLTGTNAASVYTLTMPANFTVPINRRVVVLTSTIATLGASIQYDEAGSAANTVVCRGAAFGGGALDVSFQFLIYRIEMLP
jgi:hypothetical protein